MKTEIGCGRLSWMDGGMPEKTEYQKIKSKGGGEQGKKVVIEQTKALNRMWNQDKIKKPQIKSAATYVTYYGKSTIEEDISVEYLDNSENSAESLQRPMV